MSQSSEVATFAQTKIKGIPLPFPPTHQAAAKPQDLPYPNHELVLRNILSTAPLGMYHTDLAGRLLRLPGKSGAGSAPEPEPLIGFIHPQDRKLLSASWKEAMEAGKQWSGQFRYRSADGQVFRLHAVIAEVRDRRGDPVGYQGCNIDMTAQAGAHEETAVSEDRYRVATEAADAGIWDMDVAGNRCYLSPYCFEMLGYKPGQAQPRLEEWTNILHPDYLEAVRRLQEDCIEGALQKFELEFRLKTNEGKWRWFSCKGKADKRDASGKALRVAGTLVDINGQKMMEHLLRMEHDLLDLITATSPVGIMFIEPDRNIAFANPRAEAILGLSKQELTSRGGDSPIWSIVEHRQEAGSEKDVSLGEMLEAGHCLLNACFVFHRPDGGSALLSISTAPFLDKQSKVGGTVVTLEDVTEQKRREQAMADSDRLLRETQRIAQLGSYVLDLARDRWSCSSKLEEILGVDDAFPRSLRGHIEVVHEDYRELFTESYLAAITQGRPFEMEYKIRRCSDKAQRWVAECCELSSDKAGLRSRMIGTIKDITERKAAEEAIRNLNDELDRRVIERTSQLAAAKQEIESFSYSVSHDLRAPLRHINSYSSILVEEHGSKMPEEARQYLERICTASSRMGKQIDDLLTLTRVGRAVMKRQTFDISVMASEVADMLREVRNAPGTEFLVQQGLSAYGDSVLVRLVLQNLLGNSVKYSSGKPSPRVEFGQTAIPGRQAFYVRDNGVGFDMAYIDKLFQPFQRLHGSEFEGTGIGLATVRRIIERHGGSIWAEGKENGGATFYFTLSQPRKNDAHPGSRIAASKSLL